MIARRLRKVPHATSPTTNGCAKTSPFSRRDRIVRFPTRKWSTQTDVSTKIM